MQKHRYYYNLKRQSYYQLHDEGLSPETSNSVIIILDTERTYTFVAFVYSRFNCIYSNGVYIDEFTFVKSPRRLSLILWLQNNAAYL